MATDLRDIGVGFTNDSSQEEISNREALIAEERDPELKKDIATCETALATPSYIMELPEDVLRIIFDLICHPRFDRIFGPLALSYVCSAWRQTILNMPHIWAQFPLRATLDSTGHGKQLPTIANLHYRGYPKLRLFHLWLTRGGSLPRTELSLCNYDGYHSDVVKHLVAPFTFLKLRLAPKFDEMHTLREIPPEHMLRLQTLHIGCYGSSKELRPKTIPAKTLRLPPRLPCLVDLTLCDCFAEHLEKLITAVPWHNLKELFLQFDIPSTTCLNLILRQGMSLVSCALKPTSDDTFSNLPDTEPSIVLPCMDNLVLHCSSHADVATFERLVLTPARSARHIETYACYGDDAYRPS